jgi:hypothetical protein
LREPEWLVGESIDIGSQASVKTHVCREARGFFLKSTRGLRGSSARLVPRHGAAAGQRSADARREGELLDMVDLELFRASAVLASAVTIDAMVLTVCDFEVNSRVRRALQWASCVTLAHWGLAALGLSGLWTVRAGVPAIAPFLQIVTVLLLCALTGQIVLQPRGAGIPTLLDERLGFAAKVWIVSVDAFFVGAGQSAAAGSWARGELLGMLWMLGPMILACVASSVVAAQWVSRLVKCQVVEPRRVAEAGAIGLPVLALPIFSYLLLCALRGFDLN